MAFKAKKKVKGGEDSEDWLATYADAITLLLAFFVVLLSIAEPKQSKYEEVKQGLMSEFSKDEQDTPFNSILDSFNSIVVTNEMSDSATVEETDDGVIIELDSNVLFESGSAKLKKAAAPILEQVAYSLMGFEYEDYTIEVEGHTDDVPISTARFPSNWELSAGRAINVVKFFMALGVDPMRLKAAGYADTRPKVPNRDAYGNPIPENQAYNRRVAIRLEKAD